MNMSQVLHGQFYQGVKPVAQRVEVHLEEATLRLSFTDSGSRADTIWIVNQINPDQTAHDGRLILSYGRPKPDQYLELMDENALQVLSQRYPWVKWTRETKGANKRALVVIGSAFLLGIVLLAIGYFFFVPRLADRVASGVPKEWETDLASKMKGELIRNELVDSAKSVLLDSFFGAMQIKTAYDIRFYFLKDSVVNAFAIPGGSIVVYQGLFDRIENYESLAGLIGHEFTHVEKRHSLKSMFRSVSTYMILALVFGDLTGISGVLLENANSIQNLNYSRSFEQEADAEAVRILQERRISLDGMLHLFEVFLKEGSQGVKLPEFLSTHPVTTSRIDFVKDQKAKSKQVPVAHPELERLFNRLKEK